MMEESGWHGEQLPGKENKVGDPSWRLCSLEGINESHGQVPSGLPRKPRYASPRTVKSDLDRFHSKSLRCGR